MTKKEQLLHIALTLFANEGYTATSTSKIAKAAQVSEALIFRHFNNKKGLLDTILEEAEIKSGDLILPIMLEENPKLVIKKAIELPFTIHKKDYDFWRLQFKLKWQSEYNHPKKMEPFIAKLTDAFAQLNYAEPTNEALLLNQIVLAISTEILKGNFKPQKAYKTFLLKKYQV
tara:strand:- start:33959 stop:34477 length:519 start_codon:yes stop_codon:yes gene_type:complete